MTTQQRQTAPAWRGFFLIVVGFLAFIVSYFLLPLYITTVNCFDYCTPPVHHTTWEDSLIILEHIPYNPFIDLVVLILDYLPLLAVLIIFGLGVGFLIQPQRFFVKWLFRSWLTGIVSLLSALPFLFFLSRPEIGYLGMLVSYGLFFGGYRVFLAAHPEWQRAP